MKIAVLFEGFGHARKGLEEAGHECVGVELDLGCHTIAKSLCKGEAIHSDPRNFPIRGFDAVWLSRPNDLEWALHIGTDVLWVEHSVMSEFNNWGRIYNAAQFIDPPELNLNIIIGGRYKAPKILRPYKRNYHQAPRVCDGEIPIYMAKAFGEVYAAPEKATRT